MQTPNQLNLCLTKQTNVLDDITCYEPVDVATLDKLLTTDLLVNNFKNPMAQCMMGCEKKQLTRYKSLINRETNLASVCYKRTQGMSYGRSNPKMSLSMFSMRKQMRHSLAKRVNLSDWDMVNAHPAMLLQLCKANGLCCNYLEDYVLNRDAKLNQVMSITKCDRERAKVLFICLLFFGTFRNWLNEEKDQEGNIIYEQIDIYAFENHLDVTDWIDKLTAQLQLIGNHIMKENPKLVKEVEKNKELKKEKNYNKIGSVVSYFLQEYEIRVLEALYLYCNEMGYIKDNVCVLCADGIMLQNELITDANIPFEFNKIVKEKIGFDLQFLPKELDQCLSDEDIESHIISADSLDKSKFDRFNIEYFNSLAGYNRKKIYFEMFICKVLRPDPIYIYIEIDNGGLDEMVFYTQNKITDAFNHLKAGENYDNGEEAKFMTKWLNDEKIKCFNKMDFIPYNEKDVKCDYIFNLFRGFNPKCKEEYEFSKRDKLLKPFLDLGLQLCGNEKNDFDYLLKYIADIFQNPRRKNPVAFIIKGKQGTGKNVWLNAIGNALGRQHYITSSNPKDFFGDYAEGFYHKLLVNMNECEGKDTFDYEGRIKSFITEDTITLNRKFVQPITISNLARLIIFTNKQNPIPIDVRSKDRRYVVYETTDEYLQPKYGTNFWKQLVAHFNRPDFMACLYDYLNEIDINEFDWKTNRPITKAYIQMCKLYVPTEVLFMEHKLVDAIQRDLSLKNTKDLKDTDYTSEKDTYENDGITGVQLYKEYTDYCKTFGFYKDGSYQKNIKCFYSKLNELELPMIQKNPQNLATYYFTIDDVMKYMKERKWIDRSDDDIKCETANEIKGDDFKDYFDM